MWLISILDLMTHYLISVCIEIFNLENGWKLVWVHYFDTTCDLWDCFCLFFLFEKCQTPICLPWAVLYVVPGTLVYDKLAETLTENSLVKGIKQASPFSQTRSLEGFHSALNYFAPKMIAYSYVGIYCRWFNSIKSCHIIIGIVYEGEKVLISMAIILWKLFFTGTS